MKHVEGNLRGQGGTDLYFQGWIPEEKPRAALILVHGAGDHTGRFERLVTPLVEGGIACYGYDQRGYGRSGGQRGHINAWSEFREDLQTFYHLVVGHLPETPVFLFGYSLGALVALDYVLRDPAGLQGVVLSATPIEPVGVASPLQVFMARMLSRIKPNFTIALTGNYDGVSRDTSVVERLRSDPLHHDLVTARWGAESLATAEWVRTRAAELRLPVLFIHGEADPVNQVEGTRRYFEQVTYPDKSIRTYPGSKHETHNDLDHAQVATDILRWMLAHLPGREARSVEPAARVQTP